MHFHAGAAPSRPPAPPSGSPLQVARTDFSDADEMAAALRQASMEAHVLRGGYRGSLLQLVTEQAGLQWGFHEAPLLTRGTILGDGVLLVRWGPPVAARCNGQEVRAGAVFYPSGSEHQSSADAGMAFASICVADLESMASVLAPDLRFPAGGGMLHLESAPAEVQALQGLVGQVRSAIDAGAELLRDPAARRGLREALGAAVVRVLSAHGPRRVASAAPSSALVRRLEERLSAEAFRPVHLSELCGMAGASEAQLRRAFIQVYGVGPVRYLRLRRLHLVRRALMSTGPADLTVSAAAARLGFFEFGRFAGEYRALFGELPSETRRLP